MNNNNRVGVDNDDSETVTSNGTQSETLCKYLKRRKVMWIILTIIAVVIITMVTILIVKRTKTNNAKTSTTKETTTEIIVTTKTEPNTTSTTTSSTSPTTTSSTSTSTTSTATTMPKELISPVIIDENTTWKQSAITVAGGHGKGKELNQLDRPRGFYVDEDSGSIFIADSGNDRIVRWKFGADTGEIVTDGNGFQPGINKLFFPADVILDKEKKFLIISDQRNRRLIQLSLQNSQDKKILISDILCRGLAMHSNGDLYITDWGKQHVRRWQQGDKASTIVAGGNGQGNQLNQFNEPEYIFVDEYHSIYVADYKNNRVMKWMKNATEGTLVVPGEAPGKNPNSLMQPTGVIVDHVGNIYVSSFRNSQITRWSPGAIEGVSVVGEKQFGSGPTQLNSAYDLSFDRQGNLYVADVGNHRIQKFDIDLE